MQKQPRVKARRLLDLAHTMPCFATFPHECNERYGCHPAHANWQRWGKGVGVKVSDWAFAAVCGNAHRELDGTVRDPMPKEHREHYWFTAFVSTQDYHLEKPSRKGSLMELAIWTFLGFLGVCLLIAVLAFWYYQEEEPRSWGSIWSWRDKDE
jgi:hypothetical protein